MTKACSMRLKEAELATLLAALRFYQADGKCDRQAIDDIATNCGTVKPLSIDEIDKLCERINCCLDDLRDYRPFVRHAPARLFLPGDEELEAVVAVRKSAGQDVNYWAGLLKEIGETMRTERAPSVKESHAWVKQQLREAQRMEKAATLWLRHWTEVGRRSLDDLPTELDAELSLVLGAAFIASVKKQQA